MGCLQTKQQTYAQIPFSVSLNTSLIPLFKQYKRIMKHIQSSQLFAHRSPALQAAIQQYLKDPLHFDKHKIELCSIDSVHKCYPLQYQTDTVCEQWLIEVCLAHHKFISECNVESIQFSSSFRAYIEFLYLCSKEPEEIIIPKQQQRFMWSCHMQDHINYMNDMKKTIGFIPIYAEIELLGGINNETIQRNEMIRKMHLPEYRRAKLHNIENFQQISNKISFQ